MLHSLLLFKNSNVAVNPDPVYDSLSAEIYKYLESVSISVFIKALLNLVLALCAHCAMLVTPPLLFTPCKVNVTEAELLVTPYDDYIYFK
jgi:hypothetical protein